MWRPTTSNLGCRVRADLERRLLRIIQEPGCQTKSAPACQLMMNAVAHTMSKNEPKNKNDGSRQEQEKEDTTRRQWSTQSFG
ncbi:hypothetical protein FCULG_00012806 [Fusarium culmorum]|uniref:Uncharacterized protein n=1 Tax=Fusarium culmorum TaxID=5516 RepID=A0A2T4GIX5_FUSCU|nr:hypothetical protein FCULG_00012836 [Fusarium culmorum]PTD03491.1 hypothetical protein FCULG_00012806 [Fusarium culmorum]